MATGGSSGGEQIQHGGRDGQGNKAARKGWRLGRPALNVSDQALHEGWLQKAKRALAVSGQPLTTSTTGSTSSVVGRPGLRAP